MKDFLGNELQIGDYVAFLRRGYRSLCKGQIVDITPCKARILPCDYDAKLCPDPYNATLLQFSDQIVKIQSDK